MLAAKFDAVRYVAWYAAYTIVQLNFAAFFTKLVLVACENF